MIINHRHVPFFQFCVIHEPATNSSIKFLELSWGRRLVEQKENAGAGAKPR